MAGIERALAQRIVDELTEFGVAPEMVGREVKCDSGRIDVVVYTQPRCLIELKVSLDSKTQGVAIKELMLYRRGYPGARLFIWAHAPLIRVDKNQLALLNRRGIRLWTRKIASEIALECRRTPPELACPPPRPIPRRRSDLSPEQVDAYLTQLTEGAAYRTVRRRLTVAETLQRIRPDEREEARSAVYGLGVHKAHALAPLLRRRPRAWRELVDDAGSQSEGALQHYVTQTLKLKSRGAHLPGESWYKELLVALPSDSRADVAAVFQAAFDTTKKADPIAAFLRIVHAARPTFLQAATVSKPPDSGD